MRYSPVPCVFVFLEGRQGLRSLRGPGWCKRIPFPAIQPAADGIREHSGSVMRSKNPSPVSSLPGIKGAKKKRVPVLFRLTALSIGSAAFFHDPLHDKSRAAEFVIAIFPDADDLRKEPA